MGIIHCDDAGLTCRWPVKGREEALNGQPWSHESFEKAAAALARDFQPLSDWRASAEYRMLSAQNLLRRFFLEQDAHTEAPVQLAHA